MAEQRIDVHRPIKSNMKCRKIRWREAENPVRWAFEKQLREHDRTKREFAVDPYAEVYQFRDNLYGIYLESLDGMGDPWSYLLVGPQKAMLIDTGFGLGDLKGLVEEIIGDMPLIVVNTHAHFDHAYGNAQFDTVYCHEYEVKNMERARSPHIWDYLFDENGNGIWSEFDRKDIIPFRNYEIVGLPNHHIFNLGGDYEVELIFLPGHTCGHAVYLDKKNRILFGGDDMCIGALFIGGCPPDPELGKYATVSGFYAELCKLCERLDEFDSIFPGHGMVDLGNVVLLNIKEACERVLANPFDRECVEEQRGGDTFLQYREMIYLSGYLTYTKETI